MPSLPITRSAVVIVGLCLTSLACPQQRGPGAPTPGNAPPRQMTPPAPQGFARLQLNPGALPAGARAHFPPHDAGSFYVTLPSRPQAAVAAQDVMTSVIVPVLRAVGFERGPGALRMPPANGVRMPTARFQPLGADVAVEYAKMPQLLRPQTRRMLDVFTGRAPATPEIDAALSMGEGQTFAQFVAGIERLRIQFAFQQV